jgi:hypothetical protein
MSLFFLFPMNTYSKYCLVLQTTEKNLTQIQIHTVCDRNMTSMYQMLTTGTALYNLLPSNTPTMMQNTFARNEIFSKPTLSILWENILS